METCNEDIEGVSTSESPAEGAAIRIVSNLPAASREAGNDLQATSSDRARTRHEEMDFWTDEDDDDEDIDIDELEDDMAELEEELDHGAWDGVPGPPAGFPDYVHGALPLSCLFCLDPFHLPKRLVWVQHYLKHCLFINFQFEVANLFTFQQTAEPSHCLLCKEGAQLEPLCIHATWPLVWLA